METTSKTDASLNTTPNTDVPLATYELRKPFEINGKKVTELILDLDALSTNEYLAAQDEHEELRKSDSSYRDSKLLYMYVARMNGLNVRDLTREMKAGDARRVSIIVGSFFTDTD